MASGLEVAAAGCVGVGNKGGLLALTAIATPTKRALEKRDPLEVIPAFVAVPDIADAWSSKRASVTRANAIASPNVVGLTTNNSRLVMSSASSAVTYTYVYTDSEPGRVFWGADEEIFDGGSPRVIVYGYDGLPMQPVAPSLPDYIPGPEDPQTPLVSHDEDEREAMFIQPHDPDYVPEPIYPEYIPLDDEHVFLVEEQPLPPVDSPTVESLG
ncbi:hypothetical protein Tco_0873249, partial [Tanacetum coccineum]